MWSYLSPNQLAIPRMFNCSMGTQQQQIPTIQIADKVRNLSKLYPLVRNNDPFFNCWGTKKH